MDDLAKLNSLAEAELDSLAMDGIHPSPSEIVELNYLCWRVENPQTRLWLSRGRPVFVGGVSLWPLTLRGSDWLVANGVDPNVVSPELGYAMCFSRSDGNEMDLSGNEARSAVKSWYSKLVCTEAEFVEAVCQVASQDFGLTYPSDANNKPMTAGDFSAYLSARTGTDPEIWERKVSISYCNSLISALVMQAHASKKPCLVDPVLIADACVGACVKKIRERHMVQ